jgi:hypothetical protein
MDWREYQEQELKKRLYSHQALWLALLFLFVALAIAYCTTGA